jgi:hypothetical protein
VNRRSPHRRESDVKGLDFYAFEGEKIDDKTQKVKNVSHFQEFLRSATQTGFSVQLRVIHAARPMICLSSTTVVRGRIISSFTGILTSKKLIFTVFFPKKRQITTWGLFGFVKNQLFFNG